MADLPRRRKIEADLAAKIGKEYGKSYEELIRILKSGGRNVDDAFWREFIKRLQQTIGFELEEISLLSAASMADEIGMTVNWDLINQRAADWARQYGFDLVSKITDGKRTLLQKTISDFYEERLNLGQVKQRLLREFGAVRAEMIAVTETTRAAAEGERIFADDLRSKGVELKAFWVTNEDAQPGNRGGVCPICAARDGKAQGDGWTDPPPAHPKCRCWLRYEVVLQEGAKADFRRVVMPLAHVQAIKSQTVATTSAAGLALTMDVIQRHPLGVGKLGLWARWAQKMGTP